MPNHLFDLLFRFILRSLIGMPLVSFKKLIIKKSLIKIILPDKHAVSVRRQFFLLLCFLSSFSFLFILFHTNISLSSSAPYYYCDNYDLAIKPAVIIVMLLFIIHGFSIWRAIISDAILLLLFLLLLSCLLLLLLILYVCFALLILFFF